MFGDCTSLMRFSVLCCSFQLCGVALVFFFKQKTAYEMRISDWSSDVCSSDLLVRELIERWRGDPGSTYQSWFLWEERLKNFRSIRRGISQVVAEIEAGTFGAAYRGSSLEIIVHSVAEQRQIFKGADHAFLWKPKLRIPDI